jgi:hypothetical protein
MDNKTESRSYANAIFAALAVLVVTLMGILLNAGFEGRVLV